MSTTKTLDLVFTIDGTSSMGSYIGEAQKTISRIVDEISSTSQFDVRFGLVEYRDHPPERNGFVTKNHGLTVHQWQMQSWLDTVQAIGGGDIPEAVADGLLETLQLWTRLSSRASAKDVRVCVLIADAPPHGLYDPGDSYPSGCPDGHDPLEIANKLAENGVTVYVVGCEPSISPYRDFFMAIAKITGGLYIPLAGSSNLSQVIVGVAREEISLRELMDTVECEVKEEYTKNSGVVDEETVSRSLYVKLEGKRIQQLQMDGGSLPKISAKAKRFARFDKVTNVKHKFVLGPADTMTSMSTHSKFEVVEKDIDITQIQRMVQKAIMINHIKT